MKIRPFLIAAAVVVGTATLAACGNDSNDAAAPETTIATESLTQETLSPVDSIADTIVSDTTSGAQGAATDFNDADVTFAQNMIPHHQQAVEMAAIALDAERGASDPVKALATQIQGAQDPEIEMMSGWLSTWGKPLENAEMDHSSMTGMAGMMSDTDMQSLETVTGAEFDNMWMTMMIAHHQGAIDMSTAAQSDGQNAELKALAGQIITAQNAEIDEMKKLLQG